MQQSALPLRMFYIKSVQSSDYTGPFVPTPILHNMHFHPSRVYYGERSVSHMARLYIKQTLFVLSVVRI